MIERLKIWGVVCLAAMLSIALLTSCGNQQQNTNNDENNQQNTEQTETDPAEEKVALKLNLPAQQTYRMKMTTVEETEQTTMGQLTKSKNSTETVYQIEVTEVADNGNMTLDYTYESIKNTSEGPDGVVVYDSNVGAAEDEVQGKIFQAMLNRSFEIVMTPQGRVESVGGIDELFEAMMDTVDAEIREFAEPLIKSIVSPDTIKDMITTVFVFYPQEPLAISDSWTETFSITTGLTANLDSTYTVMERDEGIMKLDVATTLTSNPDAPPLEIGPFKMRFKNLEGTGKGSLTVDEATGWYTSGELTQNFTAQLELEGLEAITEDEPATIEGKTVTSYEMLDS